MEAGAGRTWQDAVWWGTRRGAEPVQARAASDPVARYGLAALYGFTAVAVAGYAVFGRSPWRLASQPAWALEVYARSFGVFAVGHIVLAFGLLAVVLLRRAGAAWLPALLVVYLTSLGSELAGTTWGLPFGGYAYGELLGPKWLGRVPTVIPLSWFCMAAACYAVAAVALERRALRVLVAAALLLVWDLALDPAMSDVTRYWVWSDTGPYYGMPWLNLFGWGLTGVVLMALLSGLRAEGWTSRVGTGWWAAYYVANLALPVGLCVAAGAWLAVVVTALALVVSSVPLAAEVRVARARRA